jgi:hypothetical protein
VEVTTAILCDSAQIREGLLFVLAGGITRVRRSSFPANLAAAVAVVLELDRIEAQRAHEFELVAVGEDGEEMARVGAQIQVGDAPVHFAENIQVPLAVDLHGAVLPTAGAYELRLYVDGNHRRTIQFWAEDTVDPNFAPS